jgi:hypothetical protein
VINEKGIVDVADRLTSAPLKFGIRAHGILAQPGTRPEQLPIAMEGSTGVGYRRLGGVESHREVRRPIIYVEGSGTGYSPLTKEAPQWT